MESLRKNIRLLKVIGSGYLLALSFLVSNFSYAVNLPNGGFISDAISVSGEIDEHTFTANAGDTVLLRIADTETTEFINSSFFPRIELIDPSGNLITSGSGALVGDIERFLVVSGQYTVRALDASSGDDKTGTYNLYYAKAPGANDDGVLQNGGVVSGEIELGDLDSYSFNANAGETVFLRVADTETTQFINSSFFPNVTLFDPSGVDLTSGSGALVGDISQNLVSTGTYTVVISDESSGEDATGSYDLYYAKAPGANDDGVLQNGSVVSEEIELGDLDSYSFTANAGETVYLRVADTETTQFINSSFFPNVALFDPSGAPITSGSGALVGDISASIVSTGTYTVIIRDESSGEDATGTYNLYYAKAPGANDNGCIADGQSANGFIDLGDIDSYSFNANAGTSLLVTLTDLDDSNFFPSIRLLSPSGAFITSDSGAITAQIDPTLLFNGQYTLIVTDESSGEDATGNYRLDISGVSVTCPSALCNGLAVTVDLNLGQTPGPGDDVVLGTPGNDDIRGRSGNDTICGMGGNDFIHGNSGDDWIDGGDGIDNIRGGQGSDILFAGSGATLGTSSRVFGGTGNDTIFGGPDSDDLRGGRDDDVISGEQSSDLLIGNEGNDVLYGGTGADDIRGGLGDTDELFGEGGNDSLNGGSGNSDFCDGGGQGGDTDVGCEIF